MKGVFESSFTQEFTGAQVYCSLLEEWFPIRDVAKLSGKGVSTVQRVKKEFVT